MSRFTLGISSVLRVLFAREVLPAPPPPAAPAPASAWRLLAPEPLPPDLPPLPRRPGRWLSWLFAAEPLDP